MSIFDSILKLRFEGMGNKTIPELSAEYPTAQAALVAAQSGGEGGMELLMAVAEEWATRNGEKPRSVITSVLCQEIETAFISEPLFQQGALQ